MKIYYRSIEDGGARPPNFQSLNRYNSTADFSLWLKFGVWVRYMRLRRSHNGDRYPPLVKSKVTLAPNFQSLSCYVTQPRIVRFR